MLLTYRTPKMSQFDSNSKTSRSNSRSNSSSNQKVKRQGQIRLSFFWNFLNFNIEIGQKTAILLWKMSDFLKWSTFIVHYLKPLSLQNNNNLSPKMTKSYLTGRDLTGRKLSVYWVWCFITKRFSQIRTN